jgi:hypothetical protein
MDPKTLKRFGTRFAALFRTPDYKALAKRLDIPAFHHGGCKLTAYALKAAIGGTVHAIAEHDPEQDDWPLHHYILKHGTLYIDSTGTKTERQALAAIKTTNTLRIAPVRSKWPDNGLWTGDHTTSKAATKRITADAKAIAAQLTDTR